MHQYLSMLWSKIGRSVLREIDNSRLLLWFVGGKVHKVICGNCWHLLTQEQRSYKYQWTTPLMTNSQLSLPTTTNLEEVRILVLCGLLGSLAVSHLSSFTSLFRSLVRGV